MTNEEAIKYLKQLYPNGGHCWLDEQRIEAIGMAVKALQEEPASEDLEKFAYQSGYAAYPVDMAEEFGGVIRDNNRYQRSSYIKGLKVGAQWKEQQLMAKAVDAIVQPYDAEIWLNSQNDLKEFAEGEEVKVIILKKQ